MSENESSKKLDLRTVSISEQEPDDPSDEEQGADETPASSLISEDALSAAVEALLFASAETLTAAQLSRAIQGATAADVRKALTRLEAHYEETERAFEIVQIAGGYQLLTRREFAPFVQKLKKHRDLRKLTPASIETLSIIAYNPRIIRADIENIRGVGCGPILRALTERKLIRTAGRSDLLGSPLMYETTREFLDHFGLASIKDLPKLSEFTPLRTAPAEEPVISDQSSVISEEKETNAPSSTDD